MSECGNWQKYQNQNPAQKWLINRFSKSVVALIQPLQAQTMLDAGCAEGFVSQRILKALPGLKVLGVDIDQDALNRGRQLHPEITFKQGSVLNLPFDTDAFDLVLCTEVLEHVEQPARALAELRRVSRRYCLLSVPYEPFFCAMNFLRGKNISRWGNDEDHRNLWGARKFHAFVTTHLNVLASVYPIPWQVILAEV